jgi:hypothetical protein
VKRELIEPQARKPGPKKPQRSDLTLAVSVAEAAVVHARDLKITQADYWNQAVQAYFRYVLLNPPEPIKVSCEYCGSRLREPRSRWKRIRIGTRWEGSSLNILSDIATDYYNGTWSRALEAAVRHYLGDRNPPPEGQGKIMGVKLKPGIATSEDEVVHRKGGRPAESLDWMIRKHGGKA